MKILNALIFVSLSTSFFAQEKHALVVAVSDYPSGSPWSDLSSDNDVHLIMDMLKKQQFPEQNIIFCVAGVLDPARCILPNAWSN